MSILHKLIVHGLKNPLFDGFKRVFVYINACVYLYLQCIFSMNKFIGEFNLIRDRRIHYKIYKVSIRADEN